MHPASGEPGRNGDHRPLEFSTSSLAGTASFAPPDHSEIYLTRQLRVAGSARQAHRINRLAPKAQTAGSRITRRHRLDDPTVGNGARSSNVLRSRDAAVIWQCPVSPGCLAKWG